MWVVGVGASRRELDALTEFVSSIPKNVDACFIVVQRVAPHVRSMMLEFISRQASVPVHLVVHGTSVRSGSIYVVPPHYDVDFKDGQMVLTLIDESKHPQPSTDHFFVSLAQAYGAKAVGVVLKGTGSDCSEGILAIQSAGGLALIQGSPSTMRVGSSHSSLMGGRIDYVSSPREINRRLKEILKPEDHSRVFSLGTADAEANVLSASESADRQNGLYIRKKGTIKPFTDLRSLLNGVGSSAARKRPQPAPSMTDLAQTQILSQHEIAGVVVDIDGAIQSIVGEASDYLEVKSGVAEFTLQNLLPQLAGIELQLLLRRTAKSQSLESSRTFTKIHQGKNFSFQIFVKPFYGFGEKDHQDASLFLVTFKKAEAASDSSSYVGLENEGERLRRVTELEQELAVTREHLQTVIEELGIANEELQLINEDLQVSNREFVADNEELQSTNEELTTLNEELNAKAQNLSRLNGELEKIQASLGVPFVAVDSSLKVQRFNEAAQEIFDIGPADVATPIDQISCRAEIDNFEDMIRDTVTTSRINEGLIRLQRHVYQMRILPRRDKKQKIVGAVIVFLNNTAVMEKQEAYKKSEAQIRSVMSGASSFIILKDTMGRYLSVNRAFAGLVGRTEKEITGKTDQEIFSSAMSTQLRNADLEAMLQRKSIERAETWTIGDRNLDLLVSRFAIYDESDSHPYAIGTIAVDVTLGSQAHKELQKSESLYRSVVEDQTVCIARFTAAGRIQFVNKAFVKFFGGEQRDYVGRAFVETVEPTEKTRIQTELARLSPERLIIQIEHRVFRFSGQTKWLRWIAKGIVGSDGQISEIQAVGLDITDYRLQTDQMIQREMLFGHIFTYTTDFLTVFKVTSHNDLVLESFNRTAEQGGYSLAQYVGRSIRDLINPSRKEEILALYEHCLETQRPQSFDEELSFQSGARYLETTIIPIVNSGGKVERVVALSRDVSHYKQTEIELTKAKEAAEVANQSKSDFLASMSHELRSPLNVVIGMAQLLEDAFLKEEERKQVESIQRSGRVLLSLIEDILDLSRIEAGKVKLEFTPLNVNELVREVFASFEIEASHKAIKLVADSSISDTEEFVGDHNRIRQILTNLVGNAVKFTDKGSVTVQISSRPGKTMRKIVRFDVKDTGIGIPVESHSRIFQRFSQVESSLSRRYGGSGLGLVISKRLTTLMSGRIDFSSEWGKGSHFWFEVPLAPAPHIFKSARNENGDSSQESSKKIKLARTPARILAVDDNPDSQMVLSMVLKRLGHSPRLVDSGQDALEIVQQEEFDLILMDVQMPGMDGYETTMAIRRLEHLNKDLPIIAVTANAMVGDSERCFEAGMNDYMTKPFEAEALRLVIDKWVSRKLSKSSSSDEKPAKTNSILAD